MSLTDLKFIWSTTDFEYTGVELRPHFILEKSNHYGSCILGFFGSCKVPTEHLVDQEDRLVQDYIQAKSMFHFIAEFYDSSLEAAVLYQRLLIATLQDALNQHFQVKDATLDESFYCKRDGDDLYILNRKLSVSIATLSVNSVLIHWGFNYDSAGAPVSAIGFKDLGFSEKETRLFLSQVVEKFVFEVKSIKKAQYKIRSV